MNKNEILSSAMANEQIAKLNARKDEIAKAIAEKREAFDKSDVEVRDGLLGEIETLKNEDTSIDEDLKELDEIRSKFEEQEKRMSVIGNLSPNKVEERKNDLKKDVYDTPEYRQAWVDYIRTGNDKEVRAMATTTSNVPVPTIWQSYVETAWANYGKFSRLVTKSYIPGYLSIPFESAADEAVIHTEGSAAPDEESITLGVIELKPAMIKKWISMTDELMAMTADDFMRYLADELVYRVVLKLDNGIINGALDTNGKGIVGIVGNTNTLDITAALSFNVTNEAVAQLVTFDNITVAMNPATFFKNYMGLTDLQERPIYQIATDNSGKPQYFVNGMRVEFTLALPAYDAAEAGDVWAVIGDFRGYRLNLPEGEMVRTLVDPYSLSREDKVAMVGRLYAAGNVARLKHFAQLKKPQA